MDFICRMHTPEDIEPLIRFWSEHSGWGAISKELWEHRFLHTPLGPAAFALAVTEDTGEIIGQFGFIPSLLSVDGVDVKAYRPVATITREDLRKDEGFGILQQAIFQMYMHASEQLGRQGAALIHMVPDPRWLRLFSMLPFFKSATFPLYTLDLPLEKPFDMPENVEVIRLDYSDARIDDLWEKARLLYRTMLVRNTVALGWKNSHAAFDLWGIVRESRLIGVFSAIVKGKERKWQLCDALSEDADDALRITLRAACNEASRYVAALPPAEDRPNHIAALATPLLKPELAALGFGEIKYGVSLVVHVLDENLPQEAVAPENWYLTPNE